MDESRPQAKPVLNQIYKLTKINQPNYISLLQLSESVRYENVYNLISDI